MKPEPYSTNTLKNNLLSKIKPNITVLLIIGLTTIITLFNIISLFTPFAALTRKNKLTIVVFGALLIFLFFHLLYNKLFYKKLHDVKQLLGKYLFPAIIFATIIISITNAHSPLYPTSLNIRITTTTPLGFFQSRKILSNDKYDFIYDYSQTLGDWNKKDGILFHMGTEPGELTFEGIEFVNKDTQLIFSFIPQDNPTTAKIEVNENSYDIHVPSSQNHSGNFNYPITISQLPPLTKLWQVWVAIFPVMRWLFLVIYFFFASVLIGFNNKRKHEIIIRYCLLFTLGFLFYNALLIQNKLFNYMTFDVLWIFLAISAFIIIPLLLELFIRKYPKSKLWIIISIFLIAIGLRFYWIQMVPTAQVSDFGRFHQWALQLASGEGGLFIDRHATFTCLLGLIYKVFPTHQIIEVLNIVFSLVTMFSIWQIGKTIHQEKAGIIGAYFFGIFPSQISMVTIVCADIIAVALLSLSLLFFISFIKNDKYSFLFLGSVLYGFAVAVRSPLLIYSPLLILAFTRRPRFNNKINFIIRLVLIVMGLIIGYIAVNGVTKTIQVNDMVIEEGRNVIWPLMNGTNIEAHGRNNPQDTAMVHSWDEDVAFQKGINIVLQRLLENPFGFINILKYKYAYMFGDATYGASTAFLGEDMNFHTFETNWFYETADIRVAFALLCQYSYWMILGLGALLPFTQIKSSEKYAVLMALISIISALIFYTFFEVQPRYQRPIIPSIILLASLSFIKFRYNFQKWINSMNKSISPSEKNA
jgi:hypothetical protein